MNLKWLPALRGTCLKMDKNYPKMSQVEGEPNDNQSNRRICA